VKKKSVDNTLISHALTIGKKVIAPGSHYLAIEVEEVTQMLMIRTLHHNTTHHGNDMMFMLSLCCHVVVLLTIGLFKHPL